MKHLILGLGEVGTALQRVLACAGFDPNKNPQSTGILESEFEFVHICFPYSEIFDQVVLNYKKQIAAPYFVIHSTVPVGTSRTLGVTHSPMRGKHPYLEESLKVFVKYVGGAHAQHVAQELSKYGMQTEVMDNSDDTEALKLWDTAYYFWNIQFMRAVKGYCDSHGLDFDLVYTRANESYNRGYYELGQGQFIRPVLEYAEGPTGGHCLVPNAQLLDDPLATFLLREETKRTW